MTITPARRWLLLALVITAGVINYIDRQIIAVLKPVIEVEAGWSDTDYGTLASLFQFSAALAFIFTGWIVDKLGVKWANPIGVIAWSIAAMAHGLARSFFQFALCRIALGATEAMGTPSSIKTIATVFERNQRSLGYGLSNGAATAGAIVTPLLIPAVAAAVGWRGAFVAGGLIGLAWAVAWLLVTRGIKLDPPPEVGSGPPGYGLVIRDRRTWAIAVAKALSDQTWWLLLFWAPDFLHRTFGLGVAELGVPLAIVYACSAVGSVSAGYISTRLLNAGYSINSVRKGSMLVSALLVMPIPLALYTAHLWQAVALLGLTLAAHQGFSVNLFALIADVTPQSKVGTVTSFGALVGNLAGMNILFWAGVLLDRGYGYLPLFLVASVSYLAGLAWIQLLLPRLERVADAGAAPAGFH